MNKKKILGEDPIGVSFKDLSLEQQKGLLLNEIRKSMRGVRRGRPFGHLLRYAYEEGVIKEAVLELSGELNQKGEYFLGEPPTQIAWIEFAGTPL